MTSLQLFRDIQFLYPAALLIPFLYFIQFLFIKKIKKGVPYSDISILKIAGSSLRANLRTPVLFTLKMLFLFLVAIAASRPHKTEQLEVPAESRNIMLTLDLSGSMSTADFKTILGRITRLEGVKSVVREFIQARTNDRLGLVVFGTNAFLQSPMTMDHKLLDEMVSRLQVGIAGEDTAIGDGLGLSLKHIQDIEGSSKAIILVTDGVNRVGAVNPLKAANVARDLKIKVHTIGIGSKDQVAQSRFGLLLQNSQAAEFDEETLKKIAEITGGVYYNASSLEGLKNVYDEIDRLEKTSSEEPDKNIVYEYFPVISIAALIIYCMLILLSRTYFLKVPA